MEASVTGRSAGRLAIAGLAVSFWSAGAWAADPTQIWAVTGVAADDVLHLRDMPHGDSRILADIPPSTRGLKGFGCLTPEPSFDRWAEMTPAERSNAKLAWCRVEYRGQQGWVAARFLTPETPMR